jgi:streptogramin lyase
MPSNRCSSIARGGAVLAAVAVLAIAPGAFAQTFTEFTIPTAASSPVDIVAGPDGNLWFTESAGNKIGRITPAGVIAEFTTARGLSTPQGIVAGPDGNLWFTEQGGLIGKITTAGTITEFALPQPVNSFPSQITVGPDGNLWFPEMGGIYIDRITTAGVVTRFPLPTDNYVQPESIVQGSDGNLWFTESAGNKIGKITTAGVITEYSNPDAAAAVRVITPGPDGYLFFTEAQTDQIAAITTAGAFQGEATPPTPAPGLGYVGLGPDGAVWFSEQKANKLGRLSLAGGGGGFSEFAIPTSASMPAGLTAGPDGNLWFTEQAGNKIGRFVVPASVETSPLVASVLPASRSVASGGAATAFATIINSANTALSNCQIVPLSSIPASFSYQTTNPSTNALTGSPNTPVTIAGGNGSQSFVLAFTANAPFTPTNVALSFICNGVDPAAPIVGLNTLLLSASSTPAPDIVALAATVTNDGELHIPGASGAAAFSVATANVGATGSITATADTGSATEPVTLTICQTNPATGACVNPATPGPSATVTINANATPTFAIFATASGTINFAPATNRIFVRFEDSSGVVHGATSVAVRTQ